MARNTELRQLLSFLKPMSQLTGLQTGTSQSDLFIGEINIVDLTDETSGAGIRQAIVNALSGDDDIQWKR